MREADDGPDEFHDDRAGFEPVEVEAVPVDDAGVPADEAGFGGALAIQEQTPSAVAAMAQQRFELEALVSQARYRPRVEREQFARMRKLAQRVSFAQAAEYAFKRGRKKDPRTGAWVDNIVRGVSVRAARPLAMLWRNLDFGFQITRWDEQGFSGYGYCTDLENAVRARKAFDGVWKYQRVDRKSGETEWVDITDERDKREHAGKAAAIAERNAILSVLPPDLVEDVIRLTRGTAKRAADGDLASDRASVLRNLVAGFGDFGITEAMIVKKIGHPLEQITAEELDELRRFDNSLRKEGGRVEDFFEVPTPEQPAEHKIDLKKAKPGEPVDPPGGQPLFEGKGAPKK